MNVSTYQIILLDLNGENPEPFNLFFQVKEGENVLNKMKEKNWLAGPVNLYYCEQLSKPDEPDHKVIKYYSTNVKLCEVKEVKSSIKSSN